MSKKAVVYLDAKCGPSQMMRKAIRNEGAGLDIEIVLIQSDPARVDANKIVAIPTTQIVDNEEVIKTLVGYNDNIINRIKELIDA